MRLTAPSLIVLLLSILLAGAAIAENFGLAVPVIGENIGTFITLTIGYILLLLGVLIKGI